jgi:hypothetical protein
LKLVELREMFPRNLDPFQFLTGGEAVGNHLKFTHRKFNLFTIFW